MTGNIREEIENKIIDLIASGSGGRLVVFKPEDSDKDLIVERKDRYKNKIVFLNIYEKISHADKNFEKEVHQLASANTLKAEDDFYLLFINFDLVQQKINDEFLLIPSAELQETLKGNNFSKFLTNKKDFIIFLLSESEKK